MRQRLLWAVFAKLASFITANLANLAELPSYSDFPALWCSRKNSDNYCCYRGDCAISDTFVGCAMM